MWFPYIFIWTKQIWTNFYSAKILLFFQFRLSVFVPVELGIGFFLIYKSFNTFLLFSQLQLLHVFIILKHTNYINKLLKNTFLKTNNTKNQQSFKILTNFSADLIANFFCQEHCSLTKSINHLDKVFGSKLVFLSFFFHFPLNVHMSAQLFYRMLGFHFLEN